jgi:hypothetical protein
VSNSDSFDRRQNQRRKACPNTVGRSNDDYTPPANASGITLFAPQTSVKEQRQKHERRLGERRTSKLGPPKGSKERRFRPDLRGVAFPFYYNSN